MITHRAQLLITSKTLSRHELADILQDAANTIERQQEYEGNEVEVFVIDDMEDEKDDPERDDRPTKEHRKNLSEYHKANPNSGQFHPGSSGNQKISNPEIGELRQTYKDREFVRGEKMKFYKKMADKYNISSDHIRTILRNDLWRNT